MALSKQNRDLIKEIDDIREVTFLNYSDINDYKQKTLRLKTIKEQMIRGRVIMWHAFTDEAMDDAISNYFFFYHKRNGNGRLSKYSKKYNRFKYHILEKISFRKKFELAQMIKKRWKAHKNTIEKLDALRNILAHSFLPEDRPKKPMYKGKDIFSLDGITLLEKDMWDINSEYKRLI